MKENKTIYSFMPIIDEECKIIILGSMPGAESLRKGEYYGHPRNAFWRIMFDMLDCDFTDDYDAKKKMLLDNHIALWDVISYCEREGSLDSNIKEDIPNDFNSLFLDYPNIKRVYFNGQKAYDTFRRKVGFDSEKNYIRLPSTSPAHAIAYSKKLMVWKQAIRQT